MAFKLKDDDSKKDGKLKTPKDIIMAWGHIEPTEKAYEGVKEFSEDKWQAYATAIWTANSVGYFKMKIDSKKKINTKDVITNLAILYEYVVTVHDKDSAICEDCTAEEFFNHIYEHLQELIDYFVDNADSLTAAVEISCYLYQEVMNHID